jgi:hypothetical protein
MSATENAQLRNKNLTKYFTINLSKLNLQWSKASHVHSEHTPCAYVIRLEHLQGLQHHDLQCENRPSFLLISFHSSTGSFSQINYSNWNTIKPAHKLPFI